MSDRFFVFVEAYAFPVFAAIVTIVGVGQTLVTPGVKLAVYAFFGL